jgi:DNA-binding transcriptional MerR regulator
MDDTLTLDELCAVGGVTVRTVRYYIAEGLLPAPVGHGTNARYTQEHVDRLAVIAMMKEQFLPLREIRRALDRMTTDQIADTADVIRQPPEEDLGDEPAEAIAGEIVHSTYAMPAPQVALREESNASEYISDVLSRSQRREIRAPGHQPLRLPAPEPGAASWKRVVITDEAELLIEEDVYHRRREQIDSLVAWAKRILNGT